MIPLAEHDREGVEGAVAASLERLRRRSTPLGEGITALALATSEGAAGGKRLRPRLVVASYRAFAAEPMPGEDDGAVIVDDAALWQVAAALELLHAAFVVHDDLIDGDLERRGAPNVAGLFRERARGFGASSANASLVGDAASILAGDLLLFEASRLVATAAVPTATRARLFEILDDAILVSAAGELADVENATRGEIPDTDALLDTAHHKTSAYSFEAPLLAGAVLAGASPAAQRDLADTAGGLGLAFQLVDDLIGTFGTRGQAGREPGADLREAKRTPLIGFARRSDAWPRVRSALALAHTGPIAVRRAQRELEASGARDDMSDLVQATLRRARARSAAASLPAGAVRLLAEIGAAIEERIP